MAGEVSDDALLDKYIDMLVGMLHHLPNEAATVSLEKVVAWAKSSPRVRVAHHYNAFAKAATELLGQESTDHWQINAGASLICGSVFRDAYQ